MAATSERLEVTCGCGRRLKVAAHLAGKRVRCPGCKGAVAIPEREPSEELQLALPPESGSGELRLELAPSPPPREAAFVPAPAPARLERREAGPPPSPPTTGLARHAHWLLALALLPLVVFLLSGGSDLQERFSRTLERAGPEVLGRLEAGAGTADLLRLLPDQRIDGALLGVDSRAHWAFALLAAGGAAGLLSVFPRGTGRVSHACAVAVAVGTAGVALLLLFQLAAQATQGVWVTGKGVGTLIFYLLKFIGFSYRAAFDPENGFMPSLVGFTLGVGLCEELIKALPVILYFRRAVGLDWRGACLWGLAAGLGFGVAEGVHYASAFYNGVAGGDAYVVRFVSCVALHATWSAAVAVAIARDPTRVQDAEWWHTVLGVLAVLAVPMLLHGLYDTALKRDLVLLAVLAAAGSVAWLGWTLRQAEAEAS